MLASGMLYISLAEPMLASVHRKRLQLSHVDCLGTYGNLA